MRMNWEVMSSSSGIVSYGSIGGASTSEYLRGILVEMLVADVRVHMTMSLLTDFEDVNAVLDQVQNLHLLAECTKF